MRQRRDASLSLSASSGSLGAEADLKSEAHPDINLRSKPFLHDYLYLWVSLTDLNAG